MRLLMGSSYKDIPCVIVHIVLFVGSWKLILCVLFEFKITILTVIHDSNILLVETYLKDLSHRRHAIL